MSAPYPRSQRLLEIAAIGSFALLCGCCLWRLGLAAQWRAIPLLLALMPLAWLATDLLSGLLHWTFDTCGSVHTPLLGQAFIRPFREHHIDPQAMTQHDFIETHGASCFAALPLLILASAMPLHGGWSIVAAAFLLLLALAALATNQCHKWAHMEQAATPPAIRVLQRWQVVLPRQHHALHHTAPFDSHFCMACGWMNGPLNASLRLWR